MKKVTNLLILALCAALLLCGCSKKLPKGSVGVVVDPEPNPDLQVADCYTYVENVDSTYTYNVKWRGGGILHAVQKVERPLTFEVGGNDLLAICDQKGNGILNRVAVFCDIERGRVSNALGGYLGAAGNRAAFLEERTGAYHIFVCYPFDPLEYTGVTTLTGLEIAEGGDIVESYKVSEEGVLTVTYHTAEGSKTVTVDLTAE